jgi:hypothetical protein
MEKRGTTRRFLSRSFYLFLFCVFVRLFVILVLLVSTEEELRVNELLVDQLRGSEVLYIRGVDRLGEKNKHFYLSSRVPYTARISPSIIQFHNPCGEDEYSPLGFSPGSPSIHLHGSHFRPAPCP